jgi:hypothetical protein
MIMSYEWHRYLIFLSASEAQIFTVDAPRSFFTLFNPATPSAQNIDITLMARRVRSISPPCSL